ncbi:MAG TPA: peptidyl-prolyl cis-trans isomerase [Solirubrobacterales bacterium]|jgi:parvulin-like peptidyl-prolyl isomerase|nr:peptidyl-prolyl cis-trans isomerase [Solirubrobacterales bacterium]HMX70600.1 peptidyl-prolyl cis-trans isomerase [Solirubrobacterales bacterium]HMY25398.1 peptidyl-prolyl cis-trans isomerase [Solirubrobacterales bacterium]HNA24651.1 peptidyl-prolyl cis-trans isomerase [Solirubrobacterales bacterium]HNA44307.1 peptidyl-prolyl cis-trans isomerase [Solirubrobacterales bacterium]
MSGARKFGLILFGAILVVLFAGIAIAQGVSKPGVESGDIITVQDVPDGKGSITEEDYNRSFEQTWKRGGLQAAPKEGDAQYDQVKEAAINDLLDQAWLAGEANELGVTATDREIDNELATIKKDQFPTPKAFNDFLKSSGFTMAEVRDRVELQVLSRKIQDQITKSVTDVPDSEIENFYESSKESFTTPETRDIRLIVTDKKADAEQAISELGDDPTDEEFAKVAKKLSVHSSKTEGGKTVATEGAFPDPAGADIMSAEAGTIEGPIESGKQFYVFRVTKITPEETKPLDDVRDQIKQQLLPTLQQQAMSDFVSDYNSKWKSRTFCASDYTVERCDNFESDGRLESADPKCYEAGAGKNPDLACPAPIELPKPMAPGGNSSPGALLGQTQNLPQRPVQPSDAESDAAGAGGAGALSQLGAAAGQ